MCACAISDPVALTLLAILIPYGVYLEVQRRRNQK